MARSFGCPDGTHTTSAKKYVAAWDALTKPMEAALGMQTIGFDPRILMRDKEGRGTVEIPVWLAKRIVEIVLDKQ